MKITLIHPSRGRPKQASLALEEWKSAMNGDPRDIYHVLSLDSDDERRAEYWHHFGDLPSRFLVNENQTMVDALNRCVEGNEDGIWVTLFDDMIPSQGWDKQLLSEYKFGSLIRVNCGVPLQTICVGCASVFKRWGYFYYPRFVSMYADNDYQERGESEGLFVGSEMTITHNHPTNQRADWDETYLRQNHSAAYVYGQAILKRRRGCEFSF